MKNYFKATKQNIDIAIKNLNNKKIIIHSTDTIPGIAVDATSEEAVQNLIDLKGRAGPYSIIVKSINEISKYALLNQDVLNKIEQILPGPFTILLKNNNHNNLAKLTLGGSKLIGFRIPSHDFTQLLASKFKKPLITTSLNITGEQSIIDLKTIGNHFKELVIFDDDNKKLSKGSTIIDFSSKELKIIRRGDGSYLL